MGSVDWIAMTEEMLLEKHLLAMGTGRDTQWVNHRKEDLEYKLAQSLIERGLMRQCGCRTAGGCRMFMMTKEGLAVARVNAKLTGRAEDE